LASEKTIPFERMGSGETVFFRKGGLAGGDGVGMQWLGYSAETVSELH
jgi:hypothetical protein